MTIDSNDPMTLVTQIADWKLDAKLDNMNRYFYFIKEAGDVLNGTKAYVIGRKGTGKTAISEYICRIQDPKTFTQQLTFKNFPFAELYEGAGGLAFIND